ncbi:hypothetical protein RIF29_29958 [Crotalaria pallida]|uniref:Uncharacterized protein n=1 Tax=Crotalaria pallida TaxID=3830 RepID=A0AAN9HWC1_CROPI
MVEATLHLPQLWTILGLGIQNCSCFVGGRYEKSLLFVERHRSYVDAGPFHFGILFLKCYCSLSSLGLLKLLELIQSC